MATIRGHRSAISRVLALLAIWEFGVVVCGSDEFGRYDVPDVYIGFP
jgi:hypothetical protein